MVNVCIAKDKPWMPLCKYVSVGLTWSSIYVIWNVLTSAVEMACLSTPVISHSNFLSTHKSWSPSHNCQWCVVYAVEIVFLTCESMSATYFQVYDKSVDWWCLGAVLYEMLYGLPPFYSRNRSEMYDRIVNKPLRLRPTISSSARDILVKVCMSWFTLSRVYSRVAIWAVSGTNLPCWTVSSRLEMVKMRNSGTFITVVFVSVKPLIFLCMNIIH